MRLSLGSKMSQVNLQKLISDVIQQTTLLTVEAFSSSLTCLNGEDKSAGIKLVNTISLFYWKVSVVDLFFKIVFQFVNVFVYSVFCSLNLAVLFFHKHCQVTGCLSCSSLHNALCPVTFKPVKSPLCIIILCHYYYCQGSVCTAVCQGCILYLICRDAMYSDVCSSAC